MYPQAMPSAPPPPSYPVNHLGPGAPESSEQRLERFQFLVNRYEINPEFAMRLRALEGYEIVFIVDGKTADRSSCSS